MADTIYDVLFTYRLDVYIHDYLVKRDLKASAQAFQAEGKVSSDPVGKFNRKRNVGRNDPFLSSGICFCSYLLFSTFFHWICFDFLLMVLQLLMLLEVFFSNGGQFSGIYLLLGPMRNIRRLLLLTLRLV